MNLLKSLLIVLLIAIPAVANAQGYSVDKSYVGEAAVNSEAYDFAESGSKKTDTNSQNYNADYLGKTVTGSELSDFSELGTERVGIKELLNMSSVSFESGNYRLDSDFKLGYGDVVEISLWGKIEGSYELTINRNGNIIIPLVGNLQVAGLTISEARDSIESALDRIYSNVSFDFALKNVKDIRVLVIGNAKNPGFYAVNPFCWLVEALTKSGGPDKQGSLCDIQVVRDDKVIANFNFYDFLRKNDQRQNIRLKHGDIIFIPQINNIVSLRGDVSYPGKYEIINGEKITDLLDLASGVLPTKSNRRVLISRVNDDSKLMEVFSDIVFNPEEGIDEKDNIILENGDIVIVSTEFNYTPAPELMYKTIYLKGRFVTPGEYFVDREYTLSSIIKKAGGVVKDGFIKGAVYTKKVVKHEQESILNKLVRAQERTLLDEEAYIASAILTDEERSLRQRAIESRKKALGLMASQVPEGRVVIDLEDILKGKVDITFEDGDIIYIPSIPDWALVSGAVNNSQSVFFKEGKDLEYYINIIGGLTNLADTEGIYVIKADGSAESKSTGIGAISRGDIIVVPEKMN